MTTQALSRSTTSLATRSLRLAQRLRDSGRTDEYEAALVRHFEVFASTPPRRCICPVHVVTSNVTMSV